MQSTYTALVVMALSSIAAAQAGIPTCAQKCLADAIKAAPACGLTDVACQCEPANYALIQKAAAPCVLVDCPSSEINNVIAAANALCAAASSSASVAPLSSVSVAPSSTASVAPSSSESVAPSSSASAPSPSTTASSTAHSSSAQVYSTASPTKPAEPTTAASNGTAAPSVVPYVGSASQIAAGFGAVLALSFAVLAAF